MHTEAPGIQPYEYCTVLGDNERRKAETVWSFATANGAIKGDPDDKEGARILVKFGYEGDQVALSFEALKDSLAPEDD